MMAMPTIRCPPSGASRRRARSESRTAGILAARSRAAGEGRLAFGGYSTPGMEGNWTVPGTRDIFMISTGTKHGVNREVKTRLDAFLKQYGDAAVRIPITSVS